MAWSRKSVECLSHSTSKTNGRDCSKRPHRTGEALKVMIQGYLYMITTSTILDIKIKLNIIITFIFLKIVINITFGLLQTTNQCIEPCFFFFIKLVIFGANPENATFIGTSFSKSFNNLHLSHSMQITAV